MIRTQFILDELKEFTFLETSHERPYDSEQVLLSELQIAAVDTVFPNVEFASSWRSIHLSKQCTE